MGGHMGGRMGGRISPSIRDAHAIDVPHPLILRRPALPRSTQTADDVRKRALQLVDLVGYLRRFSELEEGGSAFKKQLPTVFWEEGGLQEAAVRTNPCRTTPCSASLEST